MNEQDILATLNSLTMMALEHSGPESPFHCNDFDSNLPSQDSECSLYGEVFPRPPLTSNDGAFTIEDGKIYTNLNLSQMSRPCSQSPTYQQLPNMERQSPTQLQCATLDSAPIQLPGIRVFAKSSISSMPSPSSCDSSLSQDDNCLSRCDSRLTSPSARSTLASPSALPAVQQTWKCKHPQYWTVDDVLDWVFAVASLYSIDAHIKSEAFQEVTGRHLMEMDINGFRPLSPTHYKNFFVNFNQLKTRSQFNAPDSLQDNPLLSSTSEHLQVSSPDSRLDIDYTDLVDMAVLDSEGNLTDVDTVIQMNRYDYPVDLTDSFPEVTHPYTVEPANDEGYSSGGSDRNIITHTNDFRQQQLKSPYKPAQLPIIPSPVDTEPLTDDEEMANEDDKKPTGQVRTRGRKPGQTTRGNHLWEFVRDLLKDSRYTPDLIKWENRELGVFRFVRSGDVARMWGKRKNNHTMNYEKLSRAMRFCRDKKYFASLPKGGKYPKKLCFRFGERAYGWQADD